MLSALAAATEQARRTPAALLEATAGGGLADRPRLVLTDALTGALLTLTDAPALRRAATAGAGPTPPVPTERYRPGAALDRHVRARDRRCRFPGCRRQVPRSGHLDHCVPWPAGPTATHLTGCCTGHHRTAVLSAGTPAPPRGGGPADRGQPRGEVTFSGLIRISKRTWSRPPNHG